jgi:hypothetical protein
MLVVVSGEGPDCIQAGEAGNGGEDHLLAVFTAQQAGAPQKPVTARRWSVTPDS